MRVHSDEPVPSLPNGCICTDRQRARKDVAPVIIRMLSDEIHSAGRKENAQVLRFPEYISKRFLYFVLHTHPLSPLHFPRARKETVMTRPLLRFSEDNPLAGRIVDDHDNDVIGDSPTFRSYEID